MPEYTLTLTPEHARVVCQALDMMSRVGMGQFEIVSEFLRDQRSDVLFEEGTEQSIKAAIYGLKSIYGHHRNGSYGIGHPETPAVSKIAYDIECVLRRSIAKAENHAPYSVWRHPPMHYAREVPLVTVEVKE